MATEIYRVRILDFKYLSDFAHLTFYYLSYDVSAADEQQAYDKARLLYLKGEKEISREELPFLFKIFSITQKREIDI